MSKPKRNPPRAGTLNRRATALSEYVRFIGSIMGLVMMDAPAVGSKGSERGGTIAAPPPLPSQCRYSEEIDNLIDWSLLQQEYEKIM